MDTSSALTDQRLLTPFLAFLSGIRTLVAGLILVALIPNLTLGAIFWLGVYRYALVNALGASA